MMIPKRGAKVSQSISPPELFESSPGPEYSAAAASERLGIQGKFYKGLNDSIGVRYGGEMDEKYKLVEDGSVRHSWEDIEQK